MNDRCYEELSKLKSFEERFEYLKLGGTIGYETFGFDRYLNQALYTSKKWKMTRDIVILRDNGCDLGHQDHPAGDQRVIVHHMNPITKEMVLNRDPIIFDPNYLITTLHLTHEALHYGDLGLLPKDYVPRSPNDTCPWRK